MALIELFDFFRMTLAAVPGRCDDTDEVSVVLERVGITLFRVMAFVATDICAIVFRRALFLIDARCGGCMALDAVQ